jgi:hypothetical protein
MSRLLAFAFALALALITDLSPARAADKPPASPAAKPAEAPKPAALTKDQERAMELGHKFIGRLKTMFELIGQNKGDCDKALKAVIGWVDELGPEIRAATTEMEALEKKMAPDQQKAVAQLMETEAQSMMQSLTPVMMEFIQACPTQMEALGKQFERLVPPTGKPAEAPPPAP